jgi:hypothetical protein
MLRRFITIVIKMRPILNIANAVNKTEVEEFQNSTLRPILKLRNDELIKEFNAYRLKNRVQFEQIKDADKIKRIFELLKRKVKLFDILNTYILNELTADESKFYLKHKRELNKRLKEMIGQRLASNLSKLTAK